jgi:hypothetical protein
MLSMTILLFLGMRLMPPELGKICFGSGHIGTYQNIFTVNILDIIPIASRILGGS